MPTFSKTTDPLFGTQKPSILEIWDVMQRVQVNFAFPQELSFYYTSPQWHAAKRVLDVGAGNGYYIGKLAARFPDKKYHGIDISPELIGIAKRELSQKNLSFTCGNLFDVDGNYDFVVLRLLLQHLDDIPAALERVAGLICPGGSVLIVDAHDPYRFFYPELPEFTAFFAAYTAYELAAGRDRRVLEKIDAAMQTSLVWRKHKTLQLLIPSTIPGNMELFTRTYTLLVDLVEQAGGLQYDFSDVKNKWLRWCVTPNAFMQVGLNLIQLNRIL